MMDGTYLRYGGSRARGLPSGSRPMLGHGCHRARRSEPGICGRSNGVNGRAGRVRLRKRRRDGATRDAKPACNRRRDPGGRCAGSQRDSALHRACIGQARARLRMRCHRLRAAHDGLRHGGYGALIHERVYHRLVCETASVSDVSHIAGVDCLKIAR
jgi:hypothetical protein